MKELPLDPVFLDYEASSLLPGSYPIEAGYSRLDLPEPISFLIRPTDSWRKCVWDPTSEAIHGIPQVLLDAEGIDVAEACRRLTAATAGRVVLSDYPKAEEQWSERLFDAADLRVPFRIDPFEDYLWARAEKAGMDPGEAFFVLHAYAHLFKREHRAGPDAFQLATVVRAALDRTFRDELFGIPGYGIDWPKDMQTLV